MECRRPRDPPARPLVLLVEGHEDTRAMYAFSLSAAGSEVVAIEDDSQAFRQLALSFNGCHADTATAGTPAIVVLAAARGLRSSLVH